MEGFSPSITATSSICEAPISAPRRSSSGSRTPTRLARVHVIPFPVNEPELWAAYVPEGVTQYIRLFSEWGGTKIDRMRDAGYEVVVLDEGAEKAVSGADVRKAIREGGEWEALVPTGVARVIRSLDRVPV